MSERAARPRLNREWHLANPMPKRPTLEQRIAWHREHVLNCACRPPPPGIQAALDRLPEPGRGDGRTEA